MGSPHRGVAPAIVEYIRLEEEPDARTAAGATELEHLYEDLDWKSPAEARAAASQAQAGPEPSEDALPSLSASLPVPAASSAALPGEAAPDHVCMSAFSDAVAPPSPVADSPGLRSGLVGHVIRSLVEQGRASEPEAAAAAAGAVVWPMPKSCPSASTGSGASTPSSTETVTESNFPL